MIKRICLAPKVIVVLALLGGCSGEAPSSAASDEWWGELDVYSVFREAEATDSGEQNTLYKLTTPDGRAYELLFSKEIDVLSGVSVRVRGIAEGQVIRVDSYEILESGEAQFGLEPFTSRVHIDPKPISPSLKVAMLILDSTYDVARARKRLNDDPTSFKRYYLDSSYGIWTTENEAFGPYDVPTAGCDWNAAAKSGAELAKKAGVNIDSYLQHMAYLPKSAGCGFSGVGQVGTPPAQATSSPRGRFAKGSAYVGSDGCVVLNQETGHNYGIRHSHFCKNLSGKLPTENCSGFQEYGDPFTTVSSGCGRLNAHEMALMRFIDGCNVVTVDGSGTFELGPLAKVCDGPQMLRVKEGTFYFTAEYRIRAGTDKALNLIPEGGGILFHYAGEVQKSSTPGNKLNDQFLIDPAGGSDSKKAIVGAGTEFKSPGGTVFKIESLGETAKITITNPGGGSGAKCLDGTEYTPKPPTCKPNPADGGISGTAGTGGTGGGSGGTGGGSGGTGGGSGGTGGVSGTGGMGTGGTGAGKGGGSGSGGRPGSGGQPGTGASSGGPSVGGSGLGGQPPTAGAGGVFGGRSGTAGSNPGGDEDTPSGCGCRVPVGSRSPRAESALLSAFLIGSALFARRGRIRKRRR